MSSTALQIKCFNDNPHVSMEQALTHQQCDEQTQHNTQRHPSEMTLANYVLLLSLCVCWHACARARVCVGEGEGL